MYRIHISNGSKGPYTEESFQIQNINNTLKILLPCTVHLGKKENKKYISLKELHVLIKES